MQGPSSSTFSPTAVAAEINLRYLWMIAFVAAIGGLLFGYDWVVIGGAKPFYEAYFHLTSESQIGWANSSALVGCFLGSFAGGRMGDHFGRKKVLLLSGVLFTVSSILTGWSFSFTAFITWRILGGVAIGLASNVSPTYIAEISPAQWRGRLVSLNQLALVIGILAAQIADWRIARPVAASMTALQIAQSWNAQYAWRWMFTAVAIPSLLFLCLLPFIPESPRWLMSKQLTDEAKKILQKIGGATYARFETESIAESMSGATDEVPWREMLSRPVLKLLLIGIGLAILQQGSGINILFNYAEDIYRSAGYGLNDILFNIVITGSINLIFTVAAMLLVDRFGRRFLMLFGCITICLCHLGVSWAYHHHVGGFPVLALTLGAIGSYGMTLAPVTWVLITEIFPNRYRGTAVSITVASLWVASFVLTYTFPALNRAVGTAGAFLVYGAFCFAGAVFVKLFVPETQGRSLESIGERASN